MQDGIRNSMEGVKELVRDLLRDGPVGRRPPLGDGPNMDDHPPSPEEEQKVATIEPLHQFVGQCGLPGEFRKYLPCLRIPKFLVMRDGSQQQLQADIPAHVGVFAKAHRAEGLQISTAIAFQLIKGQILLWKIMREEAPEIDVKQIAERGSVAGAPGCLPREWRPCPWSAAR